MAVLWTAAWLKAWLEISITVSHQTLSDQISNYVRLWLFTIYIAQKIQKNGLSFVLKVLLFKSVTFASKNIKSKNSYCTIWMRLTKSWSSTGIPPCHVIPLWVTRWNANLSKVENGPVPVIWNCPTMHCNNPLINMSCMLIVCVLGKKSKMADVWPIFLYVWSK